MIFTLEEIEEQIKTSKEHLNNAQYGEKKSIIDHLKWLENEKYKLKNKGKSNILIGRVSRG